MIELGLGIALGAGVTWLLNMRSRTAGSLRYFGWACPHCRELIQTGDDCCRGCGRGIAQVHQQALTQLDDASQVLEDLATARPSPAIKEALDAVTSKRLSLLGWKSPQELDESCPTVRLGHPKPAGLAIPGFIIFLTVAAGVLGSVFGRGIAVGLPCSIAMLAVGSLVAIHKNQNPSWTGWASVSLLALNASIVTFWATGRTENDQIALELACQPLALGALGFAAAGWLGRRALSGGRMVPGQAWLVWGCAMLLLAGVAKSRSMEEGLPALMWALIACSATVGLFSRWATGEVGRTRSFGQFLQALAGGFAVLWLGAAIKGTPWGQLASIAGAAALVLSVRGLAWKSFGWTVAGAFAGVCAIVAVGRAMEMSAGIVLPLAGTWVGMNGLVVLGIGRSWSVRNKAWHDGWIGIGMAALLAPACAALSSRLLSIESDPWVDFGSISGSPFYLISSILLFMAGMAGPGRRGKTIRDTIVAAGWLFLAGWASGVGALQGLAVVATGAFLMSMHASARWLPASLAMLAILAALGMELSEPAAWPVALQIVSGLGVATGFVMGLRAGAHWWHFSTLSVIPLVLGITCGSDGSVPMIVACLAGGWSALGLLLRMVRFSDGEDAEGSPRLAILTAAMACGAVSWVFSVFDPAAVQALGIALTGSLLCCMALTRFGDLAQRQGMALVAALLASAQLGNALSALFGSPGQAAMISLACAGPAMLACVGMLMVLCHELSPLVMLAARAGVSLIAISFLGVGDGSLMTRLALPWTICMWAAMGWLISIELDRRRQVAAIGWRSGAVQTAVATMASLGWAFPDPMGDPLCLGRLSLASCGICLGLLAVAAISGGRISVPWLTRRSCRVALERLDWCAVGMLAVSLSLEAARYANPSNSAWHGLSPAVGLAAAFVLYSFGRLAREGQLSPWSVILPATGLFLHLAWTSSRGPEENLGLLFLASGCLVALGGAWHSAGRPGGEAFRSAGIGMIALVVGFCLLEARGTPAEGPQRAFFQGGLALSEQAARGLNVGLVLAGSLVVAGLTGGRRGACSVGAAVALTVGILRQALDGQPWIAVAPQALGVLAMAVSLLRRDHEPAIFPLAGASGRESRAA